MPIFRIVAWSRTHESYESRKLKKALEWISVPTSHTTCGYRKLMDEPDGTAIYGAYIQIAALAGCCSPRGTLIRADGTPHTPESIALRVGGDSKLIARCLEVLQKSDIGWISCEDDKSAVIPADSSRFQQIPADSSGSAGIPAGRARASLPLPSLPCITTSENSEYGKSPRELSVSWEQDAQFSAFATEYLQTGASLIAEDFAAAWQFCWRTLDFEQKVQRVSAFTKRAAEFRAEPRFVPKPQKFLETEWKRDPKPPKGRKLSEPPPVPVDPSKVKKWDPEWWKHEQQQVSVEPIK